MRQSLQRTIALLACASFPVATVPSRALAEGTRNPLRTSEPVYQNPFDLAAGGASYTRATQDGVLFANPSLPAFGAGTLRSVYGRTGLHTTKETALFARDVRAGGVSVSPALFERVLKTPYHAGVDLSAGVITSKITAGVFASSRIDVHGSQFGHSGLPEIQSRSNAYAGAALGVSHQWNDLIAVGVASKPLYNAEADEDVGLDELLGQTEGSGNTSSEEGEGMDARLKKVLKRGFGLSNDAAVTLQKRTQAFDVRLALVGQDLGGTRFRGGPRPWKQTFGAGLGVTLHTRDSALHCAVDYRDALTAYGEHWTRRTVAGCKAISARWFGLAAGVHHGYLTFGGLVNLIIVRLEAGTYGREMGRRPGNDPRRVYFLAIGSEVP